MGGTDDPSNIVLLTIEKHAEAHRKLYEEHGHWQDRLAWLGLAGLIGKDELMHELCSTSKGKKAYNDGKTVSYYYEGQQPEGLVKGAFINKKAADANRNTKWYNDGKKNYKKKEGDDLTGLVPGLLKKIKINNWNNNLNSIII
jgi:hypothetical protein